MDNRSKTIVAVGMIAIIMSIGAFLILDDGGGGNLDILSDPENLSQYFVVSNEGSIEEYPVKNKMPVSKNVVLICRDPAIQWNGNYTMSDTSIYADCVYGGNECTFILNCINSGDVSASINDGVMYIYITDIYYNFKLSFMMEQK